jgi:transcription termination factor Rho
MKVLLRKKPKQKLNFDYNFNKIHCPRFSEEAKKILKTSIEGNLVINADGTCDIVNENGIVLIYDFMSGRYMEKTDTIYFTDIDINKPIHNGDRVSIPISLYN